MMTMEQLRAKLQAVNAKSGGGSRARWYPKDKHTVRLLPIDGQGEPYKVLFFHFLGEGKNTKALYCPAQNDGLECDACKLSEVLKEWDDDKDPAQRKKDFKQGCRMEAAPKYYFPMVERVLGEDKKTTTIAGPFWWSTSEFLWKEFVNIALDEECLKSHIENEGDPEKAWDHLTNPRLAFDIDVDLQKAGNADNKGNDKKFNLTKLKEKKRETPLSTDKAEVEKLLSSIPDITTVDPKLTPEQVSKQLELFLNSEAPESKSEGDGTERAAKSNNAEKPAAGKRSVDEALGELLNKKPEKKAD